MRKVSGLLSCLLLLSVAPFVAQTASAQVAFSITKRFEIPGGGNTINEAGRFTVIIEARVAGARFWAVLDEVPPGLMIESAEAGGAGIVILAIDNFGTSMQFIAESASPTVETRATIRYTVLAGMGGTYILPPPLGFVFVEKEGRFRLAAVGEPTREIVVVPRLQGEVSGLGKRMDSVEARAAELADRLMAAESRLTSLLSELGERLRKLESDALALSDSLALLRLLVIVAIGIAAAAVASAWLSPIVLGRRGSKPS